MNESLSPKGRYPFPVASVFFLLYPAVKTVDFAISFLAIFTHADYFNGVGGAYLIKSPTLIEVAALVALGLLLFFRKLDFWVPVLLCVISYDYLAQCVKYINILFENHFLSYSVIDYLGRILLATSILLLAVFSASVVRHNHTGGAPILKFWYLPELFAVLSFLFKTASTFMRHIEPKYIISNMLVNIFLHLALTYMSVWLHTCDHIHEKEYHAKTAEE